MVAVPADATADMQQDARNEWQHRAELVGHALGGVEMPHVEAEVPAALDGVGQQEIVGAHGAALRADAEELGLHGVDVVPRVQTARKDGVERFGEPFPRAAPVGGGVLHPVGDPEVGEAGLAGGASHRSADFPAADAVLDPEPAHDVVGVGEGATVLHLRVGEVGLVEVEPDA